VNKEHDHKLIPKFDIKWTSRSGPVLYVSWKKAKVGLAFFCHRQEDRCLKIFGHTTFLCARCVGICVGASMTFFLLLLNITVPALLSGILILPLLIDGFSQLFGLRESNNTVRLLTGIIFSIGFLMLLLQG